MDVKASEKQLEKLKQKFNTTCGADKTCSKEANRLSKELFQSLLPSSNNSARKLDIKLSRIMDVDGVTDKSKLPKADELRSKKVDGGYTFASDKGENWKKANMVIDPTDFDDKDRFIAGNKSLETENLDKIIKSYTKSLKNPQTKNDRTIGITTTILHEMVHNTRGLTDEGTAPGPTIKVMNQLRTGLRIPTRDSHSASSILYMGMRSYGKYAGGIIVKSSEARLTDKEIDRYKMLLK